MLPPEVRVIGQGTKIATGVAGKGPNDGAVMPRDEINGPGMASVDEEVVTADRDDGVDVEVVEGRGFGTVGGAGDQGEVRCIHRDIVKGAPGVEDIRGCDVDFKEETVLDPADGRAIDRSQVGGRSVVGADKDGTPRRDLVLVDVDLAWGRGIRLRIDVEVGADAEGGGVVLVEESDLAGAVTSVGAGTRGAVPEC